MGAQRAEAQQPSIGTDAAEETSWGVVPLHGSAPPDLPWSDARQDEGPAERRGLRLALLALAALWIGVTAYATFAGGGQSLASAVQWVALSSGPLALLGLAFLLLRAVPRREHGSGEHLTSLAGSLRSEGAELDRVLVSIAERLERQHGVLTDEAAKLMNLGDEASDRLGRVAHHLSKEGAKLDARTEALERAANQVQQEMGVLLADLPKAEERSRGMVEAMKQAGLAAHEQAGALDGQLAALAARGREADEVVGGAAQRLGAHLSRVESVTEAATARLDQAAEAMAATVDGSMARAAEAVDAARNGLEAQGAAMLAMIDQSRAALGRAGEDAVRGLSERLDSLGGRVEAIAAHLAVQDAAGQALVGSLARELGEIEQRFGALQDGSRIEGLRSAMQGLSEDVAASNERSAALIERAQQVHGLLRSVGAHLEADLPAALSGIERHAARAREVVTAIAPEVETVSAGAERAAQQLREAELSLAGQQRALEEMLGRLGEGVGSAEQQIRALATAMTDTDAAASRLVANTGPELIDALVRVREAAAQAAERARETIAAAIPESAAALGEASRKAIAGAVDEQVRQQLTELELLAERTVDAARRASERLTRQMLTIGETTAAVEERIDESRRAQEARESESFSRRVALLIESLNSTAIDVTKILSNEVTDGAWAAYLKGDRGVFTRRAVRLIDAAEAREILAHYDAEPEFREQVNRYIHDFEAMLRRVLADRDSSALGVTLLGSDMGKLYVALAQAIERIRA